MNTKTILFLMAVLFVNFSFAQEKCPVQFGKVTPKDFDITSTTIDTTLGAVIIADVGISSFEGNNKGWFNLVYKHQRRIKITNKNGFDLANVEIPLYISKKTRDEEVLAKLKAYSYNLENGEVVETKLKDDAIFKDKQDENHVVKKFTMPAVKEGTIIEYSYTVVSDFLFNLQDWSFQGSYPRMWSEYETDIPFFFEYVFLSEGYLKYDINKTKKSSNSYRVRTSGDGLRDELVELNGDVTESRWVIKNVPALKEENYVSSLRNNISRIEFQMSGQQFPNSLRKDIMGNWMKAGEELIKSEDFGADLSRNNSWLKETIITINLNEKDDLIKAKNTFNYVKKNIKNIGNYGIYNQKTIKEVFNAKSGHSNEINMLLVAMLKYQNIDASPVLLSTRSHGYSNELYPLLNRFNYVVVKLKIGNDEYYLDGSQSYLGFNKLPAYCYNGHARVIDKTMLPLYFEADNITESKSTSVVLFNDEKRTGKWSGNFNVAYGDIESSNTRKKIGEKGKADLEKELSENYTGDYTIENVEYENVDSTEKKLKLNFGLDLTTTENSKIIYLNPMLKEGYSSNPFKAASRYYPVEMPYKLDESFFFSIEIPIGYVLDEVPKSVKVSFNENEGFFEYIVRKSETVVTVSSKVKFEKAFFPPDDYESLRSFFDYIVKKHAETIVFKKKG